MTSRKHYYLEMLAKISKDFMGIWTDIDSSLDNFSSWESNG